MYACELLRAVLPIAKEYCDLFSGNVDRYDSEDRIEELGELEDQFISDRDLKQGDIVRVIKKGSTILHEDVEVLDLDLNGVKVTCRDETVRTYKREDLRLFEFWELQKGDRVKIMKPGSSILNEVVVVTEPDWHDLVQVTLSNGEEKS